MNFINFQEIIITYEFEKVIKNKHFIKYDNGNISFILFMDAHSGSLKAFNDSLGFCSAKELSMAINPTLYEERTKFKHVEIKDHNLSPITESQLFSLFFKLKPYNSENLNKSDSNEFALDVVPDYMENCIFLNSQNYPCIITKSVLDKKRLNSCYWNSAENKLCSLIENPSFLHKTIIETEENNEKSNGIVLFFNPITLGATLEEYWPLYKELFFFNIMTLEGFKIIIQEFLICDKNCRENHEKGAVSLFRGWSQIEDVENLKFTSYFLSWLFFKNHYSCCIVNLNQFIRLDFISSKDFNYIEFNKLFNYLEKFLKTYFSGDIDFSKYFFYQSSSINTEFLFSIYIINMGDWLYYFNLALNKFFNLPILILNSFTKDIIDFDEKCEEMCFPKFFYSDQYNVDNEDPDPNCDYDNINPQIDTDVPVEFPGEENEGELP